MNSLEEKIYRVIAESDGLTDSEISSVVGEETEDIRDALSDSLELNIFVEKNTDNRWRIKDYSEYLEKQFRADPELLLIVKRIIDKPELKSLFDTTHILKGDSVGSVLEYTEWSQSKGENAKYNDKKHFPKYRRVNIDWDKLNSAIEAKGYTVWSLAKEFNISTHILYASRRDNKMNPYFLEELCDFLDANVNDICKDFKYVQLRNGQSHERRVKINWQLLARDTMNKGLSMRELSEMLGHSKGYLNTCRAESIHGINEDELRRIGDILNRDYREYIDDRKEDIINLVNNICDNYNI